VQFGLPLEADHPLVFARNPKAKRYVIRLTDEGVVRVTIPRWGSKREAMEFAERERAWIDRQRRRFQADLASPKEPPPDPAVERALRQRAVAELPARLLELAAAHGFPPRAVSRISVRNQKWRWGSCSPSGHVCLNWRLVQMPDAVRDYVLIHELMHLRRMDHSKVFWAHVARACPDYQEHRRFLRNARLMTR
jgi:predicted metal-dependent hydrolase